MLAARLQAFCVVFLEPPNDRLDHILTLEVELEVLPRWGRRDGVHEGVEGEVRFSLRGMGMYYGRLRRGPYEIRLDGRDTIVLQRRL